jgi:hypothetical protein
MKDEHNNEGAGGSGGLFLLIMTRIKESELSETVIAQRAC